MGPPPTASMCQGWVCEDHIGGRRRAQAINALRGHLGEFGQIVPQGASNAARLIAIVEDPDSGLPADATVTLKVLLGAFTHLDTEISKLDAEIARRAQKNEVARRLMTVPGIGPLIATAIAVLAPPPETFRKARDFAAWLGLTPRQHSTRCFSGGPQAAVDRAVHGLHTSNSEPGLFLSTRRRGESSPHCSLSALAVLTARMCSISVPSRERHWRRSV